MRKTIAAVALAASIFASTIGSASAASDVDVNGDTGANWGPIDAAGQARLDQLLGRVEPSGVSGATASSTTICVLSAPLKLESTESVASITPFATAVINDPAATLAGGYEGSAKKFSISVSSLATYVDDRGVVA